MINLESRIQAIEDRNARVEADKGWEVSWTRRITVMIITYVTACAFLAATGAEHSRAYLPAFVPALAYLASTISIPPLRRWWSKRNI
ncbi:MAG: hypothetical protein O2904_01090 [bacterium]|nr:hypothetical protein [bacterium]